MSENVNNMEFEKVWIVTEDMVPEHLKLQGTMILSTPNMVKLMEMTCLEFCKQFLEEGETTVGAEVHLKHLAPTAVGKEVTVHATLKMREGRKIWFDAVMTDENGKCGEGSHLRVITTAGKMANKAGN